MRVGVLDGLRDDVKRGRAPYITPLTEKGEVVHPLADHVILQGL